MNTDYRYDPRTLNPVLAGLAAGAVGGIAGSLVSLSITTPDEIVANTLSITIVAMLIGLAAILLVLPGFLSDVVALALLVPPVRGWLFSALASRVRVVETTTSYRRHDAPGGDQDVETRAIELKDDDWRDRRD